MLERNSVDRTLELSFDDVIDCSTDALLENRVIVIKGVVSNPDIIGVRTAYNINRRLALPRRIAARAIAKAGLRESSLYDLLRAKSVEANPREFPIYMKSATPAANSIIDLNARFFSFPCISAIHSGSKELNNATLPVTVDEEAFPLHQDSLGLSGLGYAMQPSPTRWEIYKVSSGEPTSLDYTFDTETGDVVVLTQRVGETPVFVPCGEGFNYFSDNGTVAHRGVNLDKVVPRIGMGLFHQDLAETMV